MVSSVRTRDETADLRKFKPFWVIVEVLLSGPDSFLLQSDVTQPSISILRRVRYKFPMSTFSPHLCSKSSIKLYPWEGFWDRRRRMHGSTKRSMLPKSLDRNEQPHVLHIYVNIIYQSVVYCRRAKIIILLAS